MDFQQIQTFVFHYFSNEVILNPYVLCPEMKCWIPYNVEGILTITKHMNFMFFGARAPSISFVSK